MQENFSIPMICAKPPLVAYLERNSLFNFDQMVLGYVKTVNDSPALSISFSKQSSQIENFLPIYRLRKSTTSGAGDTTSGIFS